MAITPRDAAKINDANEVKAIKDMEGYIDGVLHKEFRSGTGVSITSSDIKAAAGEGYSKRAQEEVFKRFSKAGWHIKPKRHRARYGGDSSTYTFSERFDPPSSDQKAQSTAQSTAPPWYEADNAGTKNESSKR